MVGEGAAHLNVSEGAGVEVVGEGVAHLNVSEGVGVKVVGEGVAHPPVSVRKQRQVKEISPPGLCSALEKLA